ncbi:MAG: glycosyltransferase family 4 protein [Chitinophagaceae bacterium]|nr:glycosyltransferase family 4 protein [Chitinophagaceae bacterium]
MVCFISIPWFYPAYRAGGTIQSVVNMVANFNEGIRYKIFCSNKDIDGKMLSHVKYDMWVKYNENTEVWYASNTSILSRGFYTTILREIKKTDPDVLFIDGIYSLYFNLIPLLFCKVHRKIISVRGMLHPGALSQKKEKKFFYLFLWKLLKLYKYCDFSASDNLEKQHIKNIFGRKANIFVTTDFPRTLQWHVPPPKEVNSLTLVTVAVISPMKNHLSVLNALVSCTANITYNIYGPIKDFDYWNLCIAIIKKLPAKISVNYHGDIHPSQVEITLAKNHVFIMPSKSENFGHAIYEALTVGRPVVTSYNTPWNNLQTYYAGINANPEKSEDLVEAIKFFSEMNHQEFQIWCRAAGKYAGKAININEIKNQYRKMFFKI